MNVKHLLAALAIVLVLVGLMAMGAGATIDPDTNQVAYWCPDGGVKLEPVGTPFTVPTPPDGFTWTLLVLKAGADQSADPVNELFANPVPGQAYARTDLKTISHAILCHGPLVTTTVGTTTTAGDTGDTTTTTTPAPTTTAATTTCADCVPDTQGVTTTTARTTTTALDCGLCAGQFGTTTTTVPTTTVATATSTPATTTAAAATTAVARVVVVTDAPVTTAAAQRSLLPRTGSDSSWWLMAIGAVMFAVGVIILIWHRAEL